LAASARSRGINSGVLAGFCAVLVPDFMEWHGDAPFGDDQAIIAGLRGNSTDAPPVEVSVHQKGARYKTARDSQFCQRSRRLPHGVARDAARGEKTIARSDVIDTTGAYPELTRRNGPG